MLAVIGIALALAAPTNDPFAARAWGQFSRSPALAGGGETVDIAGGGVPGAVEYQLRLTQRSLDGAPAQRWADSRTCPAVHTVMARLHALKLPAIVPPGFEPSPREILVDGTGYSLTTTVADPVGASRVTWTSNIGTPLAAWIDDSFARLKSCWTSAPPPR